MVTTRTSSSKPRGRPASLTREEIVRVASEVFQKRGYHGATLADIARILGVSKPALYHHIRTKEELLTEIYLEVVDTAIDRLTAVIDSDLPIVEKFAKVLQTNLVMVAEYLPIFTVFFQEKRELSEEKHQRVNAKKRRYNQLAEQLYREGVDAGLFRPVEPKIATFALFGMANWIYQWFDPAGRLSAQQVADTFGDLAAHGYLLPGHGAGAGRTNADGATEAGGSSA